MKRIGVLTSGGDAPGMNAAIRSVVRYAVHNKIEVIGIFRGYAGLINEELKELNHRSVSNIINRGGTMLKTARCDEFLTEEGQRRAVQAIKKNKIDGLVLIGGDGTYRGGIELVKKWHLSCIGIPGTIDNDLNGTDSAIGCDTAVNTALEAIDKIRDTSTSMERIFVIEVMGREYGFIALQVALGGGAEEVLLPEKKFDFPRMCDEIVEGNIRGKVSWIIIVAEGAHLPDGQIAKAQDIAKKITEMTGLETREVVLGHIQRGGIPTARDRILATRLGAAAVELLMNGQNGKAVGVISDDINVVDLEFAVTKKELKVDNFYRLIKILT
ncbi:MAG: 6-phosphofructokinase [Candidatus Omnitrophica bacterium]|nr:6-phosphofructokinase [Candidatus Omnitrophota bacterium]MBU4473185.1 6-phosphofructokinase [Candidatus Omnitrophota bacterium]MCG2706556.1 6-phosphofructokinase [Candidatus Omnitrophota bacterium]